MGENLEDVITDSLNDAIVNDEPAETQTETVEASSSPAEETSTQVETPAVETKVEVEPAVKDSTPEVVTKPVEDDFSKKFGISAQGVTGRENKIPYSRVKKIVEKNEKDTVARITKELEAKYNPQVNDFTTKVSDYENRLKQVAQFEQIMASNPQQFLGMLAKIPAYQGFFQQINEALEFKEKGGAVATQTTPVIDPSNDAMPQPNKDLPDGSKVYDIDGVKALLAWQGRQTASQVNKEWDQKLQQRLGPMEQERAQQAYLQSVIPQIDKTIADARTWPNFTELEPEVVKLLNADRNISLDSAYRQAYQTHVIPRIATDRNKMRSEILAEIKKQPAATSAPAGTPRVKATPGASGAKMEDIIRQALADQGLNVTS